MSKYQDRFLLVVNYIEANLDAALDIDTLCQLTFLSKYHFHRQCSAYFGMSVLMLARLLRLKRAAHQLAYRDEGTILDIALANGYASHEAFSRVFKKYFHKSPSEFIKTPDWAPWLASYEPVLTLRKNIMKNHAEYDVALVDFPAISVAVMEHRGAPHLLGNSIRKFIEWRKLNGLPPSKSRTFNLLYDDPNVTAAEDYRMDICCAFPNAVAPNDYGVVNKMIPPGKCALVRHIGSDDALGELVNFLYVTWLAEAKYTLRDFPLFFERISFFPDVSEDQMITDIYLPIE